MATYVSILLRGVEQRRKPSGNGNCEATVVDAALPQCERERGHTAFVACVEASKSFDNLTLIRTLMPKLKVSSGGIRNRKNLTSTDIWREAV